MQKREGVYIDLKRDEPYRPLGTRLRDWPGLIAVGVVLAGISAYKWLDKKLRDAGV